MKLIKKSITAFVLLSALCFSSFRPVENEKYVIDRKESVVSWKGSMAVGPNQHAGYIYISKGELIIERGQLVNGNIEVDMNTMALDDHGYDNGLVEHLKSPDFFDVKKFPTTTFAITKVASESSEKINITGNLTIKGITHEVTFLARIEVKDGVVNANGKVTIDRSQWDVRYKSGKFFANLADGAISDSIEFDMKIVARK